tara:strand:+ start:356 stop:694 length:339 start_codon:yes stop_codon:yes gene_type:complete
MKYNSIKTISDFDSISYRGDFKLSDKRGIPVLYERGDIVLYEGKTFIANEVVSGVFPSFDKNRVWYCLAGSSIFVQSTTPIGSDSGDEWFNTTTGKLYRYLKDGSGEQWVEI